MNFLAFQQQFKDWPVFSIKDINLSFPGFDRKILVSWQKKGYLSKVKNSWYTWKNQPYPEQGLFFIANKIYKPSYISLESALSYYNLIPEGVFSITSVTSLRTNAFQSPLANYVYSNVKPKLLFGYKIIEWKTGIHYKMAEPEKALLDFLYLKPQYKTLYDFESLRFNQFELEPILKSKKVQHYLDYIDSQTLRSKIKKLNKLIYA